MISANVLVGFAFFALALAIIGCIAATVIVKAVLKNEELRQQRTILSIELAELRDEVRRNFMRLAENREERDDDH